MAVENFTTYTEVDLNSKLTVISDRITWASQDRLEDGYVYKDKGVAFFGGDFTHYLTLKVTALPAVDTYLGSPWYMSNDIDYPYSLITGGKTALALLIARSGSSSLYKLYIDQIIGGSLHNDPFNGVATLVKNIIYYLTIYRDESVGTYGRFYCDIYTDAARAGTPTSLYLDITNEKTDFRYIFGQGSYGLPTTSYLWSGYVENLSLTALPRVYSQAQIIG